MKRYFSPDDLRKLREKTLLENADIFNVHPSTIQRWRKLNDIVCKRGRRKNK